MYASTQSDAPHFEEPKVVPQPEYIEAPVHALPLVFARADNNHDSNMPFLIFPVPSSLLCPEDT